MTIKPALQEMLKEILSRKTITNSKESRKHKRSENKYTCKNQSKDSKNKRI